MRDFGGVEWVDGEGADGGGDEAARGWVITTSDDTLLTDRWLGVTILLSFSDRLDGVSSWGSVTVAIRFTGIRAGRGQGARDVGRGFLR